MNTITHLKVEIRRYTDADIIRIKEMIEAEYDRRFAAEKTNKQNLAGG
jgi:hypothetical protein